MSFIKQRSFACQEEYRFTVKTIGSPKESNFLLPISPGIRRLAEIEWECR